MMKKNWNLVSYWLVEIIPTIGLFIAAIILLFLLCFFNVCCKKSGCSKSFGEKLWRWTKIALHRAAVFIFGGKLGLLREVNYDRTNNKDGMPNTYIHNKEVSTCSLVILGSYSFFLLNFCLVTFWDVFLYKETHRCNNNLDCCINSMLITNCSDVDDDKMIFCYDLVLEVGPAVGIAGGILTSAGIIMSVAGGIFLNIYDYIEDMERGKKCCKIICIILQYLLGAAIGSGILTVIVIYAHDLTYSSISQQISLLLTIVVGISFPWYLYAEKTNQNHQTNHCQDYQKMD